MLQIKPELEHKSFCPHCSSLLNPLDTLWLGMHILVKTECSKCHAVILEDLKVSHALFEFNKSNKIDVDEEITFDSGIGAPPILENLKNPQDRGIEITKEIFKRSDRVIILNCIDYLYGHSLLKLLNARRHLEDFSEYGLIAIVPGFLRWMVPDGVSEIWTIDIPLKLTLLCYPEVDKFVRREFDRFEEIYVSKAHSHPSRFNITDFTKVPKHNFTQKEFRITFIWREDRLWCNDLLNRILKKLNLLDLALMIQNWKIQKSFTSIRSKLPQALFTVVGLGTKTKFPDWIDDCRIKKFDMETEKKTCQIYADSRLVIGVHGSNMLLPSAHAGMTIDLLPQDRLENFAQDILYQETDPRFASFRYRYLSLRSSTSELADVSVNMLLNYPMFYTLMTDRNLESSHSKIDCVEVGSDIRSTQPTGGFNIF